MPDIRETAYPCFKKSISKSDLLKIYTPTEIENQFVLSSVRKPLYRLPFMVLFKSVQRLGYFIDLAEIPCYVIDHIADRMNETISDEDIKSYDHSSMKRFHKNAIRTYLDIKSFRKGGKVLLFELLKKAAWIKDELVDIINIGIEELVHHRFELPEFNTFVRLATKARTRINTEIYEEIQKRAGEEGLSLLDSLLENQPGKTVTFWNALREEPGKASLKELKNQLSRLHWIRSFRPLVNALQGVSYTKVRHLASEAKSLDASRLEDIREPKMVALGAALVNSALHHVIDDLCEMMIKKMAKIHSYGKVKLEEYLDDNRDNMDEILVRYKAIHDISNNDGDETKQLKAIKELISGRPDLIEYSENHMLYGSKNHFRFLSAFFKSSRSSFMDILDQIDLVSTSSDTSLEQAIRYARAFRHSRKALIPLNPKGKPQLTNLDWIPDKWWYLVTGEKRRGKTPEGIHRHHFEVCLFSVICHELKSADLCVMDSFQFSDYRESLVTWDEYHAKVGRFCKLVGLSSNPQSFLSQLKKNLRTHALKLDATFPENEGFRISDKGELSLKRLKAKPEPKGLKEIEDLITGRLPLRTILDILIDTESYLNWSRIFGPISGLKAKLKRPKAAYTISSFCYGCNLGPSQTERSLPILSRRQISWINQRHISEEKIQRAIELIINAYNQFILPNYWGDGSSTSADGTKWDLRDNNLLSEYHIRYGGYGGIGYYHVSDKYIALFSRFIPCGVYEAVHILDAFFENKSEIKPEIVHGDTHSQSLTVFGLSYLLGIQLMPRIANWKGLKIFGPENLSFDHIDEIFTQDKIDWGLIECHLEDLFRIVVSIQEGRISPSIILRKLGTHSKKNKLFFAFQELGKVIRSTYLLKYMQEPELRRKVNHATTVSEAFNEFIQFVQFGNKGIIADNSREEQRKIIKYGHLVANAMIFMNVLDQTIILNDLIREGYKVTPEILNGLSPFRTGHINRFGRYHFDETRPPPDVTYDLELDLVCDEG